MLTCYEWCFASSVLRKIFRNWFSQMYLIKAWLSVKSRDDQKPRYSSCMVMVIEFHNFKILSSLLHGYHIPQLQSIAILYGFFILQFQNFTNFLPWNFFGFVIPPFIFYFSFLEIGRNYTMSFMSIIITIVSNITVLAEADSGGGTGGAPLFFYSHLFFFWQSLWRTTNCVVH